MALTDHRHRISTEEYERMAAAGAFDDGPRVELLDGWIVEMSPQGELHMHVVMRLMELLARRVPQLRVQGPIKPAEYWMPEPDIAVIAHPSDGKSYPQTALLVVEVSYSSLTRDRRKAAIYAEAGIPRYWLVDLRRACVLEYLEPSDHGYGVVHALTGDDVLDAHLDGVPTLTVAELLAH